MQHHTKNSVKQITEIHNGRRNRTQDLSARTKQVSVPMTHWYPTKQIQQQIPAPRFQATPEKNSGTTTRKDQIVVPLVTQD